MAEPPPLRAVSPQPEEEQAASAGGERGEFHRRASILLGIALAITLVLLVWSRVQLGGRIEALEDETGALRNAVAERDRLIDAHERHLEAVRDKAAELQALLDQPPPIAR